MLPDKFHRERVHFRKRLTRYEQLPNGITLHFADGSVANCDVLIGADGIKSPTRYCLYAEKAELEKDEADKSALLRYAVPRWSGMGRHLKPHCYLRSDFLVAYRGLVASNEVEKELGHPHRCTGELIMVSKSCYTHFGGYLTFRSIVARMLILLFSRLRGAK